MIVLTNLNKGSVIKNVYVASIQFVAEYQLCKCHNMKINMNKGLTPNTGYCPLFTPSFYI